MTYGLKVFAGNNILQIDSDRASSYGLVTTFAGTASTLSFSVANTLVFANRSSNGYIYPAWNSANTSVTFYDDLDNVIDVNCILAKPGNGVSGDVGTRTYGLQILASNGTTVVFDSRAFSNAGFAPIKILTAGSISATNKVITTGLSHYVCMNPFWKVGNNKGGIVRSSTNISATYSSNSWFDIIVAEKIT